MEMIIWIRRFSPLLVVAVLLPGCAGTPGEDVELPENVATVEAVSYDDLYEEGGIQATSLLNANVRDEQGSEIGHVENLILSDDEGIVAVIAEIGGFLDIGDTHIAVPWEQVTLTHEDIRIPVTENNLADYRLSGNRSAVGREALDRTLRLQEGASTGPETWKVTDLLGDYVTFEDQQERGYVDNLLFSEAGEIQAVVIESGGAPYAYPFHGFPHHGYHGPHYNYGPYSVPYRAGHLYHRGPFYYGFHW